MLVAANGHVIDREGTADRTIAEILGVRRPGPGAALAARRRRASSATFRPPRVSRAVDGSGTASPASIVSGGEIRLGDSATLPLLAASALGRDRPAVWTPFSYLDVSTPDRVRLHAARS